MEWLSGGKTGDARRLVGQLHDPVRRDRAIRGLLQMGASAASALTDALGTKDQELLLLYQQILVHLGKSATPALIRTLNEAHPVMRVHAAEILAQTRDRAALPELMDALQGEFYTVRAQAALALGQIQDPRAIPLLAEAAKDLEPTVRSAAAHALGSFADPRTFEKLGDLLLDDPEIEVRRAAAQALGMTHRAEAIPLLFDALRDSFWWYEREGGLEELLDAITDMGERAIPELIEALREPEGTVRKLAASLLARLPDPRALEPLTISLYDTHFDVCQASANALAAIGKPALPVLLNALHHPEAWIRQQAILGLTKLDTPEVIPALLNLMDDENAEVRKQVIQSLAELHASSALPALKALASSRGNREFSTLAKQAIQEINSAQPAAKKG